MTGHLRELAHRFAFNDKLLAVLAEGMQPDDWSARPPGIDGAAGGNSAHWLLGHVASARRALVRKLGVELAPEPWEQSFGMGSEPGERVEGPAPAELLADLKRCGELLRERLRALSPASAAAPWGRPFPDGADTLEGGASFLFFHETYHLGQIGILRRMRGKPRFA